MLDIQTTIESIPNNTAALIDGFLSGHNYHADLSESVFDTFQPDPDVRYMDCCSAARDILQGCNHRKVDSIFFIPHYEEIDQATVVALVRYVNIAHKGKYFIVAGDKVLYVPEHFKNAPPENIKLYVELTVAEDSNKISSNMVNKIKSWVFGVKLGFTVH